MDIRVAAYRPTPFTAVSTTTFGRGSTPGSTIVTNSSNNGPVPNVNVVQNRGTNIANGGNGGGYTDSVRGSLVNILA